MSEDGRSKIRAGQLMRMMEQARLLSISPNISLDTAAQEPEKCTQDSGIEVTKEDESLSIKTCAHIRSTGRGRIRELMDSNNSTKSAPVTVRAMGRAAMMAKIKQEMDSSKKRFCSTGDTFSSSEDSSMPKNQASSSSMADSSAMTKLKSTIHEEAKPISTEKMLQEAARPIKSLADMHDNVRKAIIKIGNSGSPISLVTNYIDLKIQPGNGIFMYKVSFQPSVDCSKLRFKYLKEYLSNNNIKTKTFDGIQLLLPKKLDNDLIVFKATNPFDQSEVVGEIRYLMQKNLFDSVYLYNVLFKRVMTILNHVRFGNKMFDPTAPMIIPQHRLEVWPGFVTNVDEVEGGVKLSLDVSHRVLCQKTALEQMNDIHLSGADKFKENVLSAFLGSVVITRYNNKTYRIDDVRFDMNPRSTFTIEDKETTYIDYYRKQYNLHITDEHQPLLISKRERRINGEESSVEIIISLIPELCHLTGLSDALRNNFTLMRDIAMHTRITANQRMNAMKIFLQKVRASAEVNDLLASWGLEIDENSVVVDGRVLPREKILMGNNRAVDVGEEAEFSKAACSSALLEVVNLVNWILMYTAIDTKNARKFVENMERNSRPMGVSVCKPRTYVVGEDRIEAWVQALRRIITPEVQIVVAIFPSNRDDRYAAFKRICCAEIPTPSQVINSRTLSNDSKVRSIVQKIALQMNCKLGGSLWTINIPFKNVMICGIDTFHDPSGKLQSVSAFVSSLNDSYTRWFSRASLQNNKQEFVQGLCASVSFGLQAYRRHNKVLPSRIIIFRDGVGDFQLPLCTEFEVPQIVEACKKEEESYSPDVTFIVVQKRINTKMFSRSVQHNLGNPPPGTVLDHTITRKYLYDFFLVSQNVRQGSVTPCHYIVVLDTSNTPPDIVQRLAYKMTFLYFNWPGSIRVPACCQYAHKLAGLVGESLRREPSIKLCDKLYFL